MSPEIDMHNNSVEEHQNPAVRVCNVIKPSLGGSCGFHLTRTKWDPYPWICGVDENSPASQAGLQVGDCVLEVNGEDILGLRVCEIATKVRSKEESVTMLLWNSGVDPNCDPESLCCGPMPSSLQRLSACMSAILSILECPVCLETIPPPAHQCGNGHLICVKCRLHSERCPVCRLRFGRGRSLLADHVYNSLTDAFQLHSDPPQMRSAKLKQRLIGKKKVLDKHVVHHKDVQKGIVTPKNKFLTRIMGKSSSVENLTLHNVIPSSNFLSSEFTPNLKTKSLSSSEIFNQGSPTLSRCSSVLSSNNISNGIFNSFRSYQGSTESLTLRMVNDFDEAHDDGALYHCPCTLECQILLKRFQVLQHIQECHPGPLVQYFRPNVKLQLPVQLPEDSNIILTYDSNTYFLKIIHDETGDLLVWLWVLGGKFKAEIYRFVVTLRNGFPENPELSFKSGVLSLAATSWLDIVSEKRGILITKDILAANFRDLQSVELVISVIRKATPPTPV